MRSLLRLAISLREQYIEEREQYLKFKYINDISKQIPVIIATHNNTIGASLHPDYLIYTEKDILPGGKVKYRTFTGLPSSTELIDLEGKTISRRDVMLDCLEAGEPAYMDRRVSYEILSN